MVTDSTTIAPPARAGMLIEQNASLPVTRHPTAAGNDNRVYRLAPGCTLTPHPSGFMVHLEDDEGEIGHVLTREQLEAVRNGINAALEEG